MKLRRSGPIEVERGHHPRAADEERARIELRDQLVFAQAQAYVDYRLGELHRAIGDLTTQLHAGKAESELRAQLATQEATASVTPLLEAAQRRTRERLEERVRYASMETKAYADEGVGSMGRSVRAAARVLASAVNRLGALESASGTREAMFAAEIEVIRTDLEAVRASVVTGKRDDFDSVRDEVAAAVRDYNHQLRNLERDLVGLRSEYGDRFDNVETYLARSNESGIARVKSIEGALDGVARRLEAEMRNAEKRIEFVRIEALQEMSVIVAAGGSAAYATEAAIVNPAKLDAMRETGIRLNVGCGHIMLDDYANVDSRRLPGIDIVAEATAIPVEPASVREIASAHLVEHFPEHILRRVVLPHWLSLLESGGMLRTVAPDGAAMLTGWRDGTMSFEDFREVLFGGQEYQGDFHFNMLTPDSYGRLLSEAGYVDVVVESQGVRNGKCFEFCVTARKQG